jgi:hypothetical protein
MKYKIEAFDALCSLRTFTVNGKDANSYDFFEQHDEGSAYAEEYPYGACGNMKGRPIRATEKVLKKYGITEEEFNKIALEAAEAVSFGDCGWCV